jgi:hypothetical protein
VLELQYLEHQDRVKRWASALAGFALLIDPVEQFAKGLPVDGPFQFLAGDRRGAQAVRGGFDDHRSWVAWLFRRQVCKVYIIADFGGFLELPLRFIF